MSPGEAPGPGAAADADAGRVVVVTGASSGIGRVAARELGAAGWRVAVVGRNPERTRAVAEAAGGEAFLADFARLDDVRRLADELSERFQRIDVLANNAGGVSPRGRTVDGIEEMWQANVVAPFLLTTRLAPRLEGGRVVFTSSVASRAGAVHVANPNRAGLPWLGGMPAYGAAKRADAMLAAEVPRRLGIDAWSFHPGWINSSFAGLNSGPLAPVVARMAQPPEVGAAALVHLVTADDVGVPPGTYFDGLNPHVRQPKQLDAASTAALWTLLERQAT